jgi:hypothetical protein
MPLCKQSLRVHEFVDNGLRQCATCGAGPASFVSRLPAFEPEPGYVALALTDSRKARIVGILEGAKLMVQRCIDEFNSGEPKQ